MQIINNPGGGAFSAATITGSTTTILVPVATNIRGVIIQSVFYSWQFGAVSSGLTVSLDCGSNATCALINEDIGPTGGLNVGRNALFQTPIQLPPGFDFRIVATLSGSLVRLSYGINYKIL